MATLTVRNVDPCLKARLRIGAAEHGRSMEAELRQIIRDALKVEMAPEPTGLATAVQRRFAAYGGVDLDLPPRLPMVAVVMTDNAAWRRRRERTGAAA